MAQRFGRIAPAQRHHAGQRQRLGLIRVIGQRLRHRRDGVGVRLALVVRQQRVGQIRQHDWLARHQPQHLPIGRHGIRVASQRFIRARQGVPAVGIVRRAAQALRQGIDRQGHVIARAIAGRVLGVAAGRAGVRGRRACQRHVRRRARVAQLAVQQHGGHGNQHAYQASGGHARALAAHWSDPGLTRGQVLQQFALHFFFRAQLGLGAQTAGPQVALQLLATREVEGAQALFGPGRGGRRAAQQRRNQAEQGRQQEQHDDDPERGHGPVSRKRAARARSSAVSGARATARRLSVRTSTQNPNASKANGPSQSSQVMGLKGGS